MKKISVLVYSVLLVSTLLSSCKKKDDDPAPEKAPSLNAGESTQLSVFRGYTAYWNLSDKITDPQGDTWSVTSVSSSNTNIVSVGIRPVKGNALPQDISFIGEDVGTAIITVVVTDSTGASRSITATVTVSTYVYLPPVILPIQM